MTEMNTLQIIGGAFFIIFAGLMLIGFGYYIYKFITNKKIEVKQFNWFLLSMSLGLLVLSLILGIVVIIESKKHGSGTNITNKTATALLFAGMGIIVVFITYTLLFLQKFAIGLSREEIQYLGETIKYSDIKAIINDENSDNIHLIYQSKRIIRRQKLNPKSKYTQFLISNITLTNMSIEKGDAQEKFEELSN